jgi:simple sugar transport system permease protein
MSVIDLSLLTSILAGGVVLAVSILFVSIGETFNQRAGVINLGIEAIISLTAFIALWVGFETGNFFLGTIAGMAMGAGIGLLHSFTTVKMRVNQLIAGLLFLAFADGLANLLNFIVIAGLREKMIADPVNNTAAIPTVTPLPAIHIPFLSDIPVIGEIFFQHNIYVYLAYFLAIVFGIFLYKTTWGLKIRAVGENPEASDAAGINVNLTRHLCEMFSGAMAGLAGSFISLGYLGLYDHGIAGGRGWIAIIVVIFSRWSPFRAIMGSLIFGLGYSVAANLIGAGTTVSYYFLLTMPYLVALIMIILFVGKTKGPAALTVPYWRK